MNKDGRISGYDLVRVWRYKSQLESEQAVETIRFYVALAVGSFVLIMAVWLGGGT